MKITGLETYRDSDGSMTVGVRLDIGILSISEAIRAVLALFENASHVTPAVTPETIVFPADVEAPKTATGRLRKPRTNPDAEATAPAPTQAAQEPATEGRSRRTRVAAPAEPDAVRTVSDADLAKACSNAAAIIGIEIVRAVMEDFHVGTVNALTPDVRERFLSELQTEIKLAQEEAEKAGA